MLPWRLSSKESACQCRRRRFHPCVGKFPWRRRRPPTLLFFPGKSQGWKNLGGYSSWERACQAPLFVGFPRQKYWRGLPFPTPGDLPNLGIEPATAALAGRLFTTSATRGAQHTTEMLYERLLLSNFRHQVQKIFFSYRHWIKSEHWIVFKCIIFLWMFINVWLNMEIYVCYTAIVKIIHVLALVDRDACERGWM